MIPSPYPLRTSDWASVPAVSGVLGITSCRINPEVNQRPPWSRLTLVRGYFSPVFQPRGGGVSPPNFLPLGYIFLCRLRPFCPGRLRPSVPPFDPTFYPARLPPEAVAVSAITRGALTQTNAAPLSGLLSECAPGALHAPRRADLPRNGASLRETNKSGMTE